MNIIRSNKQEGDKACITMIPLLLQWKIRRCNIAGCKNPPTTIVAALADAPTFGLCEFHYTEFTKEDKPVKFSLEFDN